jgi:hypothetical protein
MSQEKVKISLSVLTQQVEQGMKKPQLAEYYGLKAAQMTKVLQAAGLKIRKFHAPVFELLDDTDNTVEQEVTQAPDPIEEALDVVESTTVFEEVTQDTWV